MSNPSLNSTATQNAEKLDAGMVKVFMSLLTPTPANESQVQPNISYNQVADIKSTSYPQYQYQQPQLPQPQPTQSSYQAPRQDAGLNNEVMQMINQLKQENEQLKKQ